MKKYEVTGMSCAACVARVEKAVKNLSGVESCSVSLLTNSMLVEGSVPSEFVISAVEAAGYGAKSLDSSSQNKEKNQNTQNEDPLADKESPVLKKRLIWSVCFLIVLMYFSMGHTMWNWPLPSFFTGNHIAIALVQMILAAIVMIINKKFFISGTKSLLHKAPNMDTLVALGSGVSFAWSLVSLFLMTDAQLKGNHSEVMQLMMNLYFEAAAMILTLITVGKLLEAKSKGRTTNALKGLMKLSPKTAVILKDEKEITVNILDVKTDDIFVVRPGEIIPVDGIVIEGSSSVNESALTGESIPADKQSGNEVASGTMNQSGFLKCKATRVGQDTTINQIIQMVSDASATKAPIAKIADKVSAIFVPAILLIAVATFIIWLLFGAEVGFALARGISVLVISCPCALGLATPVAIMVGNGKAASNGILFKTAESLEATGKVKTVALDKTGTITKGQPAVTDIIPAPGISEEELLQTALNLESKSEHPLAKAIISYCEKKNLKPQPVSDFEAISGKGLKASDSEGNFITGGNAAFTESKINSEQLEVQGKTPLYFTKNKEPLGVIAVADVIKEDSAAAVKEMQKLGIKVVMLTGDNQRTASEIGKQVGVDEVIAGVLPEEKANIVKKLQSPVVMIGDGINDAPALTVADVGMAIGKGTDIAIDAADVVLVNGSLVDAVSAIRLSKKTLNNIKENLFWAFIYNIIGIPLAAGCFISAFGWTLNPMFGAAAMSLSSFCVVTNALRLNIGGKKMTKTLLVEGMMCHHCEGHVKEALEKIDGVTSAVTSHEKGTAVVELSKDVAESVFKDAITAAGYEYKGMN